MAAIVNFGGSVSTEAGQYVFLDTDAAITGNAAAEPLRSITVELIDFTGTSTFDFLEIKEGGGITLNLSTENPEIYYGNQYIGFASRDEVTGTLSLQLDGPAVTNESVTAALRAVTYTNTSSATPTAEERTVKISLAYGDENSPLVAAAEKTVLVKPANAIVLTSDPAPVTGTNGNDVFVLSSSTSLLNPSLSGGNGNDALHLVGGGTLELANFSKFWGVEAIRGSAEGDTFSLQSAHLLALSEIDGGLQDGTEATSNILQLSGSYFDFRGKTLNNIDAIELMGGTSPVFVFQASQINDLFTSDGQNLNCVINLGTNGANSTFRLSGHPLGVPALTTAQKAALAAAGFANIYDPSNTPTAGGPMTTDLNGDVVGVAPGATVHLDLGGNSTVTSAEVVRKVLVTISDSASGDLLGIDANGEIVLGSDGFQTGGTIQIGVAQGLLTEVQANRIEITFLSGGSTDAAAALIHTMTYTRPAGDTFAARQVQVSVSDDFDRTATSTVTVVDGVPRDVRMANGVTEITVPEGPTFDLALSATDEDTTAANLTYHFAAFGDAGGKFIIDGNRLKLAPDQSLNFEDQVGGESGYKVYVKAFDGTTYSAVQELTIKATNVNEAPIFVTFGEPQGTVRQGTTEAGVNVVQAFWEDPDMVADFRHNKFAFLVGSDLLTFNGGFSIDENTGQITTNSEIFDEHAGTKSLIVVAFDQSDESLRAQSTYNVEIIPQDAPPRVQFAPNSVTVMNAEGTGEGTTAFTFKVVRDVANNSTSKVNWTLDYGTATADDFSGPTTGTVEFTGNALEAWVTVLVRKDTIDEPDEETFTIVLSDLDDGTGNAVVAGPDSTATGKIQDDDATAPVNAPPSAPVLTGTTAAEYAAAGTVVGTLSAADPDAGDVLTFSLLDNADGRFKLVGNQILVADGFRLDHEQAASHTIKVKVTDRAGNAKEQSFVIGVTDINPEITAGTAGNDVFWGGVLNDVLSGNLGNDRLFGGAGNDTLKGEAGNDTLGGGEGKDKLTGGKGNDAFVFDTKLTNAKGAPNKSLANKSKDQILDFGPKYDSIFFDDAAFSNKTIAKSLKNKGASLDKPVKMKSSFFKVGDKAADKDDFFIYNARTKKLYFDVDGSGSKAMVEIASLKLQKGEGTTLSASDFFFI